MVNSVRGVKNMLLDSNLKVVCNVFLLVGYYLYYYLDVLGFIMRGFTWKKESVGVNAQKLTNKWGKNEAFLRANVGHFG